MEVLQSQATLQHVLVQTDTALSTSFPRGAQMWTIQEQIQTRFLCNALSVQDCSFARFFQVSHKGSWTALADGERA